MTDTPRTPSASPDATRRSLEELPCGDGRDADLGGDRGAAGDTGGGRGRRRPDPASLGYLIGLAALLILLTGLQRRPWAIWVNLGVQVVFLAGFVVYPGVGFIGLLFTGLWLLIAYLRAEVRRRQQ